MLEILKDEFPEVYRFTTAVFPSADDDVITSPYNRSIHQFDRYHGDSFLKSMTDVVIRRDLISLSNTHSSALYIFNGSLWCSVGFNYCLPEIFQL